MYKYKITISGVPWQLRAWNASSISFHIKPSLCAYFEVYLARPTSCRLSSPSHFLILSLSLRRAPSSPSLLSCGWYDELFMTSTQEQVESTTLERPSTNGASSKERCPIHIQTYSSYRAWFARKKELISSDVQRNEYAFEIVTWHRCDPDVVINNALDNGNAFI